MAKNVPCQRKHREILPKTEGIFFAQVVNSMILQIQDYCEICSEILEFFKVSLPYEISANIGHWHRGNFQSDRENRDFAKMI